MADTCLMSPEDRELSDAGKRMADAMNMHAVNGERGWTAFSLASGRPLDYVAYPMRRDAVKAAGWKSDEYCYVELQPDGATPKEMASFLRFNRELHKAGFRLPDPDFDYDPTPPLLASDRFKTIRHLASGGREFAR